MLSTFTYKLAFTGFRLLDGLGERRDRADLLAHRRHLLRALAAIGELIMTYAVAARRPVRKVGLRIALAIGLLVGAVFAGFPVFWMLVSSFKTNTEIFAYPPQLITKGFSFDAYLAVFNDPEEIRFFINSYVVALSVTALTVTFAIMAAYAFSRYEFRGKKVMNVVIIGTQAVPPIALIIPFFGLMVSLGLYNSYAGLILTYIVFTLRTRSS